MRIQVRYFAHARDLLRREEETFDLPEGATLAELRSRLPAAVARFGLAVNASWADDDARPLVPGDVVAVLPPVSGGEADEAPCAAPHLTEAPIDVAGLIEGLADASCGAVVLFLGTVRNEFQGVPSLAVHYEAYPEMAERELAALVAETHRRFDVRQVALRHRLGRLAPTEVSVAVAVAAPHRAEAFAACRHLIEELKRRVPIWKREVRPDGEVWHSELDS